MTHLYFTSEKLKPYWIKLMQAKLSGRRSLLEVKVLWVTICLCSRVADVALRIQPLCYLHSVRRANTCNMETR